MLLLASASPRRAELLAAAGISFETLAVDLDEAVLPGEAPEAHVRRLAEAKARAALARRASALVLGADTVVVLDGRILGKPRDAGDARAMLEALAGRDHQVLTGVALVSAEASAFEVAHTRVWFAPMTAPEIDDYIRSGEPMDKAGAYGIQGLASRYVERIEGSYTNVVGLPVALVVRMLDGAQGWDSLHS
jgi:septum formation protein